jgi:hypothetical protein
VKSFLCASVLCLGLIATSAWLIATPVYAGSYTIDCADGSKLTCSGTACQGQDDGQSYTVRGYCQCTGSNSSFDIKNCPIRESGGGGGGVIAPEEGAV